MKLNSQFSRRTSPAAHHVSRSRGVALVITVIMLSVILFMAITFLALSRRERGVVTTTKDMTLAKFAQDSALERAKAEMLANMLGTTNVSSLGLLVSTNFIRWEGFAPGAANNFNWQSIYPPTVNGLTNVNYDYVDNNAHTPLTLAQRLQNLTNLYFSPRPPVYVTNATRGVAGSYDFRYYLDLNRNGRHDRSGYWPVTNVDSSGNPFVAVLPNGQWVSNYMVGDPEWIGVLERPGFPHSSTNRFLSRYAFIVVPAGKTLDVNYIHNEALGNAAAVQTSGLDFFRNYGVGSWEINLASFLADLNTNKISGWGDYGFDLPLNFSPTTPTVNPSVVSRSGVAFQDAGAIYKFRMNGDAGNRTRGLLSVASLYGRPGQLAFLKGGFDGYSDGDLRVTNSGVLPVSTDNTTLPWSGSYNTNHLFSVQDFFNNRVAKAAGAPVSIPQRLSALGTNLSTYDQYTYYRMLSQLGSDSAYEDPDKLNLNFVNVAGFAATNFVRWDDPAVVAAFPELDNRQDQVAVVLFTNIANRLLSRYTQDWRDNDFDYYRNYFGTNQPFGVTSIPVWFSNRMVYSPSVNRLLQLAANITDSVVTNRGIDPAFPSVFRPIFRKSGNAIYITGFTEAGYDLQKAANKPLALDEPAEFALIGQDSNIYGVPWIIGAKKGLPNFNEYAMHSHFEITRKMILTRLQRNGGLQTNLMYNLSVSNAIGAEVWNSYRSNYTRGATINVLNEVRMALSNEVGVVVPYVRAGATAFRSTMSILPGAGKWPGFKVGSDNSFMIPFQTNLTHQTPATYRFNPPGLSPNVSQSFETNYTFYADPQWNLFITNRVRVYIVSGGRVVDYVQLDTLNTTRSISNDIAKANSSRILQDGNNQPGRSSGRIFKQMWNSARARNPQNTTVPTIGMTNQIYVSLNKSKYQGTDWADLGTFDNDAESQKFAAFLTNGVVGSAQVPYTPSLRLRRYFSWQANDPLVHYHSGDLVQVDRTNDLEIVSLTQNTPLMKGTGKDFGTLNARFNPWGGRPGGDNDEATDSGSFYDMSLKDPLVKLSDDWEFHTNAFPNIGWLGRVHRGTPWQTVYLKASDVGITNFPSPLASAFTWVTNNAYANSAKKWSQWSGNPNRFDSFYTRPAEDRVLFDIFTTALNENATRGQLSINQEGLAAWSAVLGGVVAITNATSDGALNSTAPSLKFRPLIIQPAGYYDPANASVPLPAMARIVNGINSTRTNLGIFPSQSFKHLGDVLATPELTTASPFLNQTDAQAKKGLNDAAYEWIPQQVMSLLRVGEPRFVVYAYGQTLQPADNSIFLGGNQVFNRLESFNGLCTNYQVTAETAARAVVRVEGSPDPTKTDTNLPPKLRYPPRLVVESYNVLGPE